MFDKGDTIYQTGHNNNAFLNSEINIVVSIYDQLDTLVRHGKFADVAILMKNVHDFIGTKHPLYPHYKYKPIQFGDTFILEHEPLTAEAEEKYPLTHRGNFTISKDQLDGYNSIHELIEDAFFKQEEIEINMTTLTTWLGDHLVETPNLGASLTDGKWVILPKPLPEPLKLKLYLKSDSDINIIDYLEMGVSGKEGNYILIDNSKQTNARLLVSLILPINVEFKETHCIIPNAKINLKIKEEFQNNVATIHSFFNFFRLVEDKSKQIALKNLSENTDFLVIPNSGLNDVTIDFKKNHQLIDRLYKIEQYYNVTFTVPEVIAEEEWEAIEILEHNMENKPLRRKLNKLTLNLDDKNSIKNILDLFESEKTVKKLMLIQSGGPDAGILLFNSKIPLEKIEIVYNSLKINDLERLRGKLEYMDEGESIKVSFVPGEDPEFKEFYYLRTSSEI